MFGAEYYAQGKYYASKGEWSTALAYFEYAISLLPLPNEITGNEKDYCTLALYYNQASHACFELNLLDKARHYTVKAIGLRRGLSSSGNDNQRILAFYYNNLGNIDCAKQESEEALKQALQSYATAIACMHELQAEQWTDEDYRQLAMYFNNQASMYCALGENDNAKKNYMQAVHCLKQIREKIPAEDDNALAVYQENITRIYELQLAELRRQLQETKAEKTALEKQASVINTVKIQDDARHQFGDLKNVSVLESSLFFHPVQQSSVSSNLDASWWLVEEEASKIYLSK